MGQKIGTLQVDLEALTSKFSQGLDRADRKMRGFSRQTNRSMAGMAVAAAAVSAALAGVGRAAAKAADELDGVDRDIEAGTGAVGKRLESLQQSMRDVSRVAPESFKTIGRSIASLNTLTGATGERLEQMTTDILNVSRVLGEDGAENAMLFGKALKSWEVPLEDNRDVLNALGRVTQRYGISLKTLLDLTTDYGPVLRNANFSLLESAEMFGRLESSGTKVSKVMPALNQAIRRLADHGVPDIRAALEAMVEDMRQTEDQTKALNKAALIFGAEGSARLLAEIQANRFELIDLADELETGARELTEVGAESQTLGEEFTKLGNATKQLLEPFGEGLLVILKDATPLMADLAKETRNVSDSMGMFVASNAWRAFAAFEQARSIVGGASMAPGGIPNIGTGSPRKHSGGRTPRSLPKRSAASGPVLDIPLTPGGAAQPRSSYGLGSTVGPGRFGFLSAVNKTSTETRMAKFNIDAMAESAKKLFAMLAGEGDEPTKFLSGEEVSKFIDAPQIIDLTQDVADATDTMSGRMLDAVEGWSRGFTRTLTDAVLFSEGSFGDIARSFASMISTMLIQEAIVAPLFAGIRSRLGGGAGADAHATGAAFGPAGRVLAHASGTVINGPQYFRDARGDLNVMGERGKEMVAPLFRIGGDLGVKSVAPNVLVQIDNQAGNQIDVQQDQDQDGNTIIRAVVRREMAGMITDGSLDRALGSTYGVRRQGVRR